jgi:hypothetical protein
VWVSRRAGLLGNRRIIVQLADASTQSVKLPADVQAALDEAGAIDARAPHPDVLPGLYVVTVPGHADVDRIVKRLSALPGVRHVELDQTREGL